MTLNSRTLFVGLVVAVGIQRLLELRLSNRHMRAARARGGLVASSDGFPAMVVLHTATLVAAPLEVSILARPWSPWLAGTMAALLGAAQGLRYWAIATLGDRWTTRVVYVPGDALVTGGPYRFIRHPNYAAVVLELAAIPLFHGAWLTALTASLANAALLRYRISVEEGMLSRLARAPEDVAR